ncbi:MAG: hypothetical protein KAU46_06500 [Candidatus Aminicenantes bacterium]|nr:hypothetical protein [Candidatus Aminicenantes bacterium]
MKNKLEVIDDFVYDSVLLDEGDNFHPATTMRAKERVPLHLRLSRRNL